MAADPPFIGIELDISDSGREGATVSTLSVTAEPNDWEGAVRVVLFLLCFALTFCHL